MNDAVSIFLEKMIYIDHRDHEFKKLVKEISLREFRILAIVSQQEFILREIAGKRAVAAQGIGRIVDRLRKRGYLEVVKNERDKRAKLVTLTPQGSAMLARGSLALKRILAN